MRAKHRSLIMGKAALLEETPVQSSASKGRNNCGNLTVCEQSRWRGAAEDARRTTFSEFKACSLLMAGNKDDTSFTRETLLIVLF